MPQADRPERHGAFRLARRAQADISRILAASGERWGDDAKSRYAGLLTRAIRQVAVEPEGRTTRERSELAPGLRSLHVRQVRQTDRRAAVRRPVHLVYYRPVKPGLVEIVRILHERMEPSRHLGGAGESED
ncbi:MAG TPA: type II toxin-antitoxin system RelE/ParE family toxin [Stellaceae bacterium]|nr:type II toxin-antitoxin system RelE/ParE family toxin [Stellaceae bacterium]